MIPSFKLGWNEVRRQPTTGHVDQFKRRKTNRLGFQTTRGHRRAIRRDLTVNGVPTRVLDAGIAAGAFPAQKANAHPPARLRRCRRAVLEAQRAGRVKPGV